ncbi:MAG: cytidine deaminase [Bdellovibrionales bacterium]|nr:cytidine deaminase [Bdellovibrionales bacterium]
MKKKKKKSTKRKARSAKVRRPKLRAPEDVQALWAAALAARRTSYSPYSEFAVGAALSVGGQIVQGCNVENASYPGCVCAERVAFLKAVSEGLRKPMRIVVVAQGKGGRPVSPCGFCLQTMAEFCEPDFEVWIGDTKGLLAKYQLRELLPHPFGPDDL